MTADLQPSDSAKQAALDREDKSRLRALWIGIGVYVLILVNTVRFVNKVPHQYLILPGLLNFGILAAMFVAMNKVRKRMRKRNERIS
jgi:hypothetical protein